MTKIKWFQLRLFRTIRRQICSIDMIDIETFMNKFNPSKIAYIII